ncbi:MAG: BolA family protein [Gammaproteobacteria bacterium]
MDADKVKQTILEHLPQGTQVSVEGEGCNFTLTVASSAFQDLSRMKSQQLIYQLFHSEIQSGQIHALSIKTRPLHPDNRGN